MTTRKFIASWDEVAYLNADHIRKWGAFEGYEGVVTFDGAYPSAMHLQHDPEADKLHAIYEFVSPSGVARTIQSDVHVRRRPCRYGGSRPFLECPACNRTVLRMAVLRTGLRCGKCGMITWGSRRESAIQRKIRRANDIADRLGLESIYDAVSRPRYMRHARYAELASELIRLRRDVDEYCSSLAQRTVSPLGVMTPAVRLGI